MKRIFHWFNSKNTSFALIMMATWMYSACTSTDGQNQQQEQVNGLDQDESVNATLNQSGGAQDQGQQQQQGNQFVEQGENMNNVPEDGGNNFGGNNKNMFGNNPGANPGANPGLTNIPVNQSVPMEDPALTNVIPTNSVPTNGTNLAPINAPVNGVPVNGAPVNAVPTNTITETPIEAPASPSAPVVDWEKMNKSPFENPQMNWPGRGRVKYITRRVTKHATPNGPIVGEYKVGNHPLIYQNGNWIEISNGTYIKGNAASDRPVGYPKRSNAYGH